MIEIKEVPPPDPIDQLLCKHENVRTMYMFFAGTACEMCMDCRKTLKERNLTKEEADDMYGPEPEIPDLTEEEEKLIAALGDTCPGKK